MKSLFISIQLILISSTIGQNTSNKNIIKSSPILPEPGVCGVINFPEEFHNDITELGEFPWAVLIARLHKDKYVNRFDCNGVLINTNHVISPGTCMASIIDDSYIASPSFVRLGEWDTSSDIDCVGNICADPPLDIPILRTFTNHKVHGEPEWYNTIGLIRLAKHVQYTKWISPICLPNVEHLFADHQYGAATFAVSGWNHLTYNMTPEVKFKRNLQVVNDEPCDGIWNGNNRYKLIYNNYRHFCVFRDDPKCRSGAGTLMAIDTNYSIPYWYAVGIVTQGPNCRGYLMCEKIITNMYWIKYILSFIDDDDKYNKNDLPQLDLMEFSYDIQKGNFTHHKKINLIMNV